MTFLFSISLFFNLMLQQEPNAHFIIESNKSSILEGECFILSASLLVSKENTVDLKFPPDLTSQILRIRSKLIEEDIFYHESHQNEIKGKYYELDGKIYHKYKLIEMAACPYTSENVNIPKLSFTVLMDSITNIEFYSEPLTIEVTPIDSSEKTKIYQNYFYSMVGDFELYEKVDIDREYHVGDTINYLAIITGEGISFPINLNIKDNSSFRINVKSVTIGDTIRFDQLRAIKKFNLELIPLIELDNYELSNLLSWKYFSLKENKVSSLNPKVSIQIGKSEISFDSNVVKKNNKSSIIALDVSRSMRLQDYQPDRISKAVEVANSLLEEECNGKILLFSGDVKQQDLCQIGNPKMLSGNKNGTALGDVIWDAIQLLKDENGEKRIILIGDGDETTGSINSLKTAYLAKELGIKIFCIGIGHKDPVPIGYNLLNQILYIENSFSDSIFKLLSEISNGKYFWLDNNDDPKKIVRELIKTPHNN